MSKPLVIRKVGNSLSLAISDIAKDLGLVKAIVYSRYAHPADMN
jgi:hypothetical protein